MKHSAFLAFPEAVFAQHTAILGKTRSGKSSVMRGMAEYLLQAGKPVCILDPKGDWWGLKLAADGKHAGFPVVIFGGSHADVPLNPRSGAAIAELIATSNRPCVIDLGGWSVGDRTRFFVDFAQKLFLTTRGQRWLLIDEVHNFVPQGKILNPQAGEMLHWGNRLASEGLGKGLALIAASQRPQKVHKDFLTSCETLVAMKVIHNLDRAAIKDWIDGCPDKVKGKEVLDSLANIKRGQGWVWSPEIEFGPKLIDFRKYETYDSFRPQSDTDLRHLAGWANVDLSEVRAKLETVIAEAEANDPSTLKKRIRELEDGLSRNEGAYLKRDIDSAYNKGREEGYEAGYANGTRAGLGDYAASFHLWLRECPFLQGPPGGPWRAVESDLTEAITQDILDKRFKRSGSEYAEESQVAPGESSALPPALRSEPKKRDTPKNPQDVAAHNAAGMKLLAASARYPQGLTWEQICTVAGILSGNGYFYGGKRWLVDKGYVEESGNGVRATESGKALVEKDGLQMRRLTLQEIVNTWTPKLKSPGPEMLQTVATRAPMSTEKLSEAIGKKPGNGYWYGGMKALRDAGLITVDGGYIRLTPLLDHAHR